MSTPARLERVRFTHGQRLRADDLGDAFDGELDRQRLHVVAAHGSWGIAEGLEVYADGGRAVVDEGAAFDRHGRVLLLREDTAVGVPDGADGPVVLVLTLRHGCAAARFVTEAEVRPGLDVPLAGFTVADGELGPPDRTRRQAARSLARPRLGAGTATVEVDAFSWPEPSRAFVDTSLAGFVDNPSYVITRVRVDATSEGKLFVWIEDPEPRGFFVCMWAAQSFAQDTYTLTLDWLGAEPPPGCRPIKEKKS